MSEDRTQAPSKRRRQQARERGQVARSPELTGSVGLLAAVALLGIWGDDLAGALVAAVREPWLGPTGGMANPSQVVAGVRRLALGVAAPLGGIIGGVWIAIVAAHQAQVGGLWAPGLLAPDPQRLWGGRAGLAQGARGVWALTKAVAVLALTAWAIRAHLPAFDRLGRMEAVVLARASGTLLRDLTFTLALATLALGLADFALQHRRFEAQLRTTPEEQREDHRAVEGDPALRAHRQRISRDWRREPEDVLAGVRLVLIGPAGLTLLLAGGPPPRRIMVRLIAQGPSGARLRRAAEGANLPQVDAPDLARDLSRRRAPGLSPPAKVLARLAALWPPAST